METLDLIFGYYDQLISGLSPSTQVAISLGLLILLLLQIYHLIKSGHWIFIAAIIVFLPGTWPAAKHIGNLLLIVIKFLLTRIQSNL